jgi:hypothetical protein
MRYVVVTVLLYALCAFPLAAAADDVEKEREAVKDVILEAYIKGGNQEWDAEKMAKGFHPDFVLPILDDGKIQKLPIAEWLESLEKRKSENPDGPDYTITHKFTQVDVVGTAALVRLELYRDGKQIFTDFLSLYKFPDGWKIVGKVFYRHP